jgi:hypothetical protein
MKLKHKLADAVRGDGVRATYMPDPTGPIAVVHAAVFVHAGALACNEDAPQCR